jgi:multidrug efflux pump subunit AcrB
VIDIRIDIDNKRVSTKEILNDIQTAVDRVKNLPPDVLERPRILQIDAREIPVFELGILGSNKNRQRDKYARELKARLEDIPGVTDVRLTGFVEREYQVLLDPRKMQALHIGIPEVTQAIQARAADTPAGFIRSDQNIQLVRVKSKTLSAEELNEIPIRTGDNGIPIRLRQVGRAVELAEEPSVLALINGKPATLLTVVKKANSDAIRVVQKAREVIKEYQAVIGSDYPIYIYNDEGLRIERRVGIVSNNALTGFVLVLAITILFLPGVLGILVSLALPMGILGTLFLMNYAEANFNIITMLGFVIVLGMLVDNAVVIGELYARHRREGMSPQEAAVLAGQRYWLAIFCSTLTTVAAFMPMLVTKGVLGQFILWIPIVVSFALMLSLIDGYFLLPARLQFSLRSEKFGSLPLSAANSINAVSDSQVRKTTFEKFEPAFARLIFWCVTNKIKTTFLFIALFISGFVVTAFGNKFELFPQEGVEFYVTRIEAPPGTNIERTRRFAEQISMDIDTVLEGLVDKTIARVGVQVAGPGDPLSKSGENVGMILIKVPPEVARETKPSVVLGKLRQIAKPDGLKSLSFEALAGGPPVGKPLTMILRSRDEAEIQRVLDLITPEVKKFQGVTVVETDQTPSGPELLVFPNRETLSFVKLSERDLGHSLRTVYQGFIAAVFYDQGDDFKLRVRFDDAFRESKDSIHRVSIFNNRGQLIPVSQLAKFSESEGPEIKRRYEFKRSITLTADIDREKTTAVALNQFVQKKWKELAKDFPAVSVKFGGEDETTKESVQSLFQALGLAALGIFGILVFAFKSFSKPFLVLSSIPLGLIGVNYAFFIHQRPLSFLALIGVLGLAGVIVNSAIILVSAIDEMLQNTIRSTQEVIAEVSAKRLRPVLITSSTTVAGLLPTAYGIGGTEPILVPMTLALGWGLFAGTILSIIWIPVGYQWILDIKSWFFKARWTKT